MVNQSGAMSIFAAAIFTIVAAAAEEPVPPPFERASGSTEETHGEPGPDLFDPDLDAPRLVQVQVEFFEIPHRQLPALLDTPRASSDASVLRNQLQTMIDKGEANAFETQLVVGRSGQRIATNSVEELIFPTEYAALLAKHEDTEKREDSLPVLIATAFETRDIGSSLEAEPTLGFDDDLVDLRLNTELTWHTGETVWQEIKDASGNVTPISMPRFYMMKVSTSIVSKIGQFTLIAVQSPKDDQGKIDTDRKILILVKCDSLIVK